MSEKMKRVRPTVTQVRALEKELSDLRETYRLQLQAEKYLSEELKELQCKFTVLNLSEKDDLLGQLNQLKKKYDDQMDCTSSLVADCNGWRDKYRGLKSLYDELEASNKHLESELERMRRANQSLSELNDERLVQIRHLKSRGFWARMFNLQ